MIQLLPKAKELWESPVRTRLMLQEWREGKSTSKPAHEQLIARWAGHVNSVVDLGCGAGRMCHYLDDPTYRGYDTSAAMLEVGRLEYPGVEFYKRDIFEDGDVEHYDVALVVAVVQHQDFPIEAIQRIMEVWSADRYVFSLLVGDLWEDLYLSTVVTFSGVLEFLEDVQLLRAHIEKHGPERFGWMILEVSK